MTNYFNPMPNAILVKNADKEKLIQMIAEKEERGWEQIGEIEMDTKEMVNSDPINRGSKYRRSYQTSTLYSVKMKLKRRV